METTFDPHWCEQFATAHSPDTVVLADPELRVVWANAAARRLLGHDVEDFRGSPMVEFVHPEDLGHALGALSEASRNDGYHVATRLRLEHDDGSYVECRVTANTVDHDGATWFVLGIRSVGDEDAIETRRRRLRALATTFYVDCASMEWIDEPERSRALLAGLATVLDAESIRIDEVCGHGGEGCTLAAWHVPGASDPSHVGQRRAMADVDAVRELPCRYSEHDGRSRAEVWLSPRTGSEGVVTIDLGDRAEQWDDANADIVALMCSSLMATVRRCNRERTVAMAATRDPLTGLLNRAAMQERLDELITVSGIDGESLAVFFADLNDFKALNDSAGHNAGDRVLCAVADALRRAIRPGDLAARVGGDEFVVVMVTRQRSLERLERRLREAVESAIEDSTGVGVAIGAISVHDGETPEELLERADAAMYADKRDGRSRRATSAAAAATTPWPGAALESLSIMLALDADARLLTATRAAYSVFGFDPSTSAGMAVLELVHPDDRALAAAAFGRVCSTPGVGEPLEVRVIDADGGCHEVHAVADNQLANPDIGGVVLTLTNTSAAPDSPRPAVGSLRGSGSALQHDA